jgi:hypothetical protein
MQGIDEEEDRSNEPVGLRAGCSGSLLSDDQTMTTDFEDQHAE